MGTALGLAELCVFLYLTNRTLKNSNNIIDNVLFCFLCQILNYKIVGSMPWISIGINLYPSDCTVILMILVWITKGLKVKKDFYMGFITIFIVMAVQSCIRGVMSFGLSSEFWADLRKYVYFGTSILYFYNVPLTKPLPEFEKKADRVFTFLTIYTLILLCFYFAGMPLGDRASDRPLLADYAVIYAAYTAYNWYKDLILTEKAKISGKTIIFTITLILNRFNTTWMALLASVGILVVVRIRDKNSGHLSKTFYAQVVVITMLVVIFTGSNNVIMQSLLESSEKFNASENNTFSSRIEVWQSLLTFVKGKYAFIGYPFGSGFHAYYRGGYWQASPHNGYIESLLRTGYIGVVSLVISMLAIMKRAFTRKNILPIMLCAVCMVFWVAYSLTFEQGIIIGLCAQQVFRREEQYELDNVY